MKNFLLGVLSGATIGPLVLWYGRLAVEGGPVQALQALVHLMGAR